jgi:hypothetical protein
MNKDVFTIQNYQKEKPFSSFLSGVAGPMGIPMWAFYVNRGQLMSSFGVTNKNGSIMEFYPANLAYHYVAKMGFRTFIKVQGKVYEIFLETNLGQSLSIKKDQVQINEYNEKLGIEIKVTYFTLPNEKLAGLVRKVEIIKHKTDLGEIELIDGLAQILPSGIDYGAYKAVSNIMQSWMSSLHEDGYVFYKLRSSTGDSAEVSDVNHGNFMLTKGLSDFVYISDYKAIFDEDTSLTTPYTFINRSVEEMRNLEQTHVNQVPCAMVAATIKENRQVFYTLIGFAHEQSTIDVFQNKVNADYFKQKEIENQKLHEQLVKPIQTKTANSMLDAYFEQCFLDNVLRGGKPLMLDTIEGRIAYYIYSRKHGDLERDYNFFHLEPSFYSQGNGNFRDVLQNRRNDLFFEPQIHDFNLWQFVSLIQADGYNPLSIEGIMFKYEGDLNTFDQKTQALLKKEFTPGLLATHFDQNQQDIESMMRLVLKQSKVKFKANFSEGYWEDHFTYIYDLIESYLSIYPDYLVKLMFERKYMFFESPVDVLPRSEKYVMTKEGKIRQYGAVNHRHEPSQWLTNKDGAVEVNLFGKLFILILNKFGHLDPYGIGLSYEANKPGWNDAMNGLPGLFASGVSEAMELLKLVKFLREVIQLHPHQKVVILENAEKLMDAYLHIETDSLFDAWNQRSEALEVYRKTLKEEQITISYECKYFDSILTQIEQTMQKGLEKAQKIDPMYPTYLTYEVTKYTPIQDQNNQPKIGHYGLPLVKVEAFELKPLPTFLEGPARYLKNLANKEEANAIYHLVKNSTLYDKKLKFYQTSVSLDGESHEIGRIRAFTPGWLERESNFLHMTYKYLLGLLKAKLYDIFFEEIKTNFTCFMDPAIYGRSPLENSSFLATSSNPDPKKHGQGFVARLTGSTAEVLSMWRYMFLGEKLFEESESGLTFKLSPKLPKTWFIDGKVEVSLFAKTKIIYYNLDHMDTYDDDAIIKKMVVSKQGELIDIEKDVIQGNLAKLIRDQHIDQIEVYISKK